MNSCLDEASVCWMNEQSKLLVGKELRHRPTELASGTNQKHGIGRGLSYLDMCVQYSSLVLYAGEGGKGMRLATQDLQQEGLSGKVKA